MSMVVNHNIGGILAFNAVAQNSNDIQKSITKLSSGLRYICGRKPEFSHRLFHGLGEAALVIGKDFTKFFSALFGKFLYIM